MKKYLEIGKIVGTHGVKGNLRVEPWCDSPEFLCSFKTLYLNKGEKSMEVTASHIHKSNAVLKLKGIDSIEQADEIRGKVLYIDRNDVKLDKDVYFIQDIINASVIDADNGRAYGKVSEVYKTGANDVYEITDENGKKYLIPVIDSVIIDTDIDAGMIKIRPIKGIFEDED